MHQPNLKNVGERIFKIRNSLDLTQEEFGSLIDGAKKGIVSRWESGLNLPNRKRLGLIATLGKIPINQLLYGSLKEYTHSFLRDYLKNSESIILSDQTETEIINEVVYQVLRNPNFNGMYASQEFELLNSSIQSEVSRSLSRFLNHHEFSNNGVINYSLFKIKDIQNELKIYLEKGIDEQLYKEIDAAFLDAHTKIHLLRSKYE